MFVKFHDMLDLKHLYINYTVTHAYLFQLTIKIFTRGSRFLQHRGMSVTTTHLHMK